MNIKRIKCFLTGGCKFKSGTTKCHIDENDTATITEICYKCGKKYSFSVPYKKLEVYAEKVRKSEEEE